MRIVDVIEFEGSPDLLLWKSPIEDFNTMSQLIVDETHEALLLINGNAADLFGPGKHTLSTQNIPILNSIIRIPTDGKTPFPCKVFYVNKVHQMDMTWGTQGAIPLEDPLYDVFLHIMLHGSLSFSVSDTRKFVLKLAGLRDSFTKEKMVQMFRGIISSHVKDLISKVMINGKLSYFMISASLMEISEVVKERLSEIFTDYGLRVEFFNIETIEVPDKDYAMVSQAKQLRASRLVQGYTWQEERQMMIAEKFAGNQGAMGAIGGIVGGAMGGMIMGSTITDIARVATDPSNAPAAAPPSNTTGSTAPMGGNSPGVPRGFDAAAFLNNNAGSTLPSFAPQAAPAADPAIPAPSAVPQVEPVPVYVPQPAPATLPVPAPAPAPAPAAAGFCSACGTPLVEGALFCSKCGTRQVVERHCVSCGKVIAPDAAFCPFCGTGQS